jgi:hypothetical protein
MNAPDSSAVFDASGTYSQLPPVLETDHGRLTPPRRVNLTAEYVSGGQNVFINSFFRALPTYIDDVTRDFGDDLYDRILMDSQARSCFDVRLRSVLAEGLNLYPAVDDQGSPDYDLAAEVKEFCERMLDRVCLEGESGLPGSFEDCLWLLGHGMCYGNKVAEKTFELVDGGPDAGRLSLAKVKVKPRKATAFVTDAFLNVVGLMGLRPGQASLFIASGLFSDLREAPNLLPREKFAVFSWQPKDGDPRGTSILRACYTPWTYKMQAYGQYLKYLAQCAAPSLIGETGPNAQANYAGDTLGNLGNPPSTSPVLTPEQALLNQLVSMTGGSAIAVPSGTKVNWITPPGDGSQFVKGLEWADDQIAKAITGQTLATEQTQKGQRAAAEVHQDTMGLAAKTDKRAFGWFVRREFLYHAVAYNWGPDVAKRLTPFATFSPIEQQDWKGDAAAVGQLWSSGYLDQSQQADLDERLGLPAREQKPEGEGGEPGSPRGQAGKPGAEGGDAGGDGDTPGDAGPGGDGGTSDGGDNGTVGMSKRARCRCHDTDTGGLAAFDKGGDGDCHWITIGAKEGEEGGEEGEEHGEGEEGGKGKKSGKRHGGSPVCVKNGQIVKGHPSLTGKSIDALKESPTKGPHALTRDEWDKHLRQTGKRAEYGEGSYGLKIAHKEEVRHALKSGKPVPAAVLKDYPDLAAKYPNRKAAPKDLENPSTRKANAQSKEYDRAVWAKRARKDGIAPEHLHQLAAEILAHDKAYKEDHTKVLQRARKLSESLGYGNLVNLKQRIAKGNLDSDALRGFDDLGQRLAEEFPEHFHDRERPEDRLFDMLAAGNPEPISEQQAYTQAFDALHDPRLAGKRSPKPPAGPKGKARRGDADEGLAPSGRHGRKKKTSPKPDLEDVPFSRQTAGGRGSARFAGLWDENKHPRNRGKFAAKVAEHSAALQQIPHGELGTVGGFHVRRRGENEYRIETATGHVTGDAGSVAEHIARHGEAAEGSAHGDLAAKALQRAEVWKEPDFFTEPDRSEKESRAFQQLPHGTRVVSLHDTTRGRLGTVARVTEESGGVHKQTNRVKLDGEDGFASNHVEPLDPRFSWRRASRKPKAAAGPSAGSGGRQQAFFGGPFDESEHPRDKGKFAPKGGAADTPAFLESFRQQQQIRSDHLRAKAVNAIHDGPALARAGHFRVEPQQAAIADRLGGEDAPAKAAKAVRSEKVQWHGIDPAERETRLQALQKVEPKKLRGLYSKTEGDSHDWWQRHGELMDSPEMADELKKATPAELNAHVKRKAWVDHWHNDMEARMDAIDEAHQRATGRPVRPPGANFGRWADLDRLEGSDDVSGDPSAVFDFDPGQPRDSGGKWTAGAAGAAAVGLDKAVKLSSGQIRQTVRTATDVCRAYRRGGFSAAFHESVRKATTAAKEKYLWAEKRYGRKAALAMAAGVLAAYVAYAHNPALMAVIPSPTAAVVAIAETVRAAAKGVSLAGKAVSHGR